MRFKSSITRKVTCGRGFDLVRNVLLQNWCWSLTGRNVDVAEVVLNECLSLSLRLLALRSLEIPTTDSLKQSFLLDVRLSEWHDEAKR